MAAHIAAHATATAALQSWCAQRWGGGHRVTARVLYDRAMVAGHRLHRVALAGGGPWRDRRVRLLWGDRVLSDAVNRYRPALLDAGMQRALLNTDVPFGAVVASLRPRRIRLGCAVRRDGGWMLCLHEAVVTPGGIVAEVTEHYRRTLCLE